MGRRNKVQNRTKKAMVESNAVNGRGCLLPGYCSFVFFGLQCQVSACADVRVRMTSGMPSVFVSEATGGAGGVPGGRAMVNIILPLQLHHAQAEMHRRKCTGQSTRSKHTPTIKRAWMRKFNTK